jgi:chromosome segregation ATPase
MSPIVSLGDRHDAITELDTALQAASTILNEAMSELVATQQKVALCSSAFTEARDEVEQAQQRLIALGNDFKKAEEEHNQCIARLIEANGDVSHLRQLVVDTNKAFLDAANAEALKR